MNILRLINMLADLLDRLLGAMFSVYDQLNAIVPYGFFWVVGIYAAWNLFKEIRQKDREEYSERPDDMKCNTALDGKDNN